MVAPSESLVNSDFCALCGGASVVWTRRGDRELRRCRLCSFAWVPQGLARNASGASIYDAAEPFFMDVEQADYYLDEGAVDAARAKRAWVERFVPAGARLLDVGANVGYFVREASDRYHATGIEPSPSVVAWGREHLGANLQVGSIDEEDEMLVGKCDAVTMFDVIEHLGDPRAALARCRRYLSPGGHLFISTPDAGSAAAAVMGSRWHYVDLVQHVSLFGSSNLASLLRETGFTIVERRTFGRRYRFSYIARRLRELSAGNSLLRAASVPAQLLRLWPSAHVALNLGDVMGLVARRADATRGGG